MELCYECFHLKQIIDEEESVSLSEWAAKRFREIISGHGWEFLKNFGQSWESDIIAIEKSTRIGMKNLLECVISDIINDITKNGGMELEEPVEEAENEEAP